MRMPVVAVANCGSLLSVSRAATAALRSLQTKTPLPAAKPSAFTTTGTSSRASRYSRARAIERNSSNIAVGTSPRWRICLQKSLLPSSCAAFAVGPKMRKPAAVNTSTIPATSGASGPTTVRSMARLCANATNAGISSPVSGTFSAIAAVPALPGATNTSAPSRTSFQAIACSRPPEPITRTRRDWVMGFSFYGVRRGIVAFPVEHVQAAREATVADFSAKIDRRHQQHRPLQGPPQ